MKAAVLYGPKDMRIEEVKKPVINSGEVLLRVKACAICGSDLHAFKGKHQKVTYPRILGHEFASIVEEISNGIDGIKAGDRVVTDTNKTCGKCPQCLNGRPNLCKTTLNFGFKMDGAFAEFVKVPAGINIYKLPDNISFEEASLAQPLGVALNAVRRRANVTVGDTVAVLGAGPIGLSAITLAKSCGARVLATDTMDFRLEIAKKMGADETVNVTKEDLIKKSMDFTNNNGFDKVIEAVGGMQDTTIQQTTQIVKPGGLIVVVGNFSENRASIRITEFKDREIELRGSRGQHGTVPTCLILIGTGVVDMKPMITHTVTLDEVLTSMDLLENHSDRTVKVIIKY